MPIEGPEQWLAMVVSASDGSRERSTRERRSAAAGPRRRRACDARQSLACGNPVSYDGKKSLHRERRRHAESTVRSKVGRGSLRSTDHVRVYNTN